jgi:hypothetical protein
MAKKIKELYTTHKIKLTIVTSLILLILNIYLLYKDKKNNFEIDKQKVEIQLLSNEIKTWKDKDNLNRAQSEVIVADLKTLNVLYKDELEVLRKDFTSLYKDYSNLRTITKIGTNTESEVTFENIDGKYVYSDKWGNFTGYFNENNEFKLNYQITNNFRFVTYFSQKRLFNFLPIGKKTIMIDVKSYNPQTSITNLQHIDVTPKRRFLVNISPQTGYGYTQYGWGWYAGVGLGFRINTY